MIKKNFLLYSLFLVVVGLSVNTTLFPMNSSSDDSDDDIVGAANFLDDSSSEEEGQIKEKTSNILSKIEDSKKQSLSLKDISNFKKETLEKMSYQELFQLVACLYTSLQKANNSIYEIKDTLPTEDVTKLKEMLQNLEKIQANRIIISVNISEQLIQILIPIIENLPGIIQAIDNALKDINSQIEHEKEEPHGLYTTSSIFSSLQTKRKRLQCLRSVLKPAFVILTVGVIVGYNMGLLPTTVSESVQNYVVSTCKSWFF